jgi:hypothetical protein
LVALLVVVPAVVPPPQLIQRWVAWVVSGAARQAVVLVAWVAVLRAA